MPLNLNDLWICAVFGRETGNEELGKRRGSFMLFRTVWERLRSLVRNENNLSWLSMEINPLKGNPSPKQLWESFLAACNMFWDFSQKCARKVDIKNKKCKCKIINQQFRYLSACMTNTLILTFTFYKPQKLRNHGVLHYPAVKWRILLGISTTFWNSCTKNYRILSGFTPEQHL